ncbi:MAG: hypothetical protein AAGE43_18710 [Pseudomonadota bacterium]
MFFRLASRMLAAQRPELGAVDGARLTRIGSNAWAADRSLLYGARSQLPLRMVVFRDAKRDLTLYSPLKLDVGTVEALDGLGTVRRLVVPNRFHTLFVAAVAEQYPDAELLLPSWNAGLEEQFNGRSYTIVGAEAMDTEGLCSDLEVKSVTLREGLDELVIYHDASELLAVGDLFFNLRLSPQQASAMTRFIYRLNGVWQRPARSRLQRLVLLKNREGLGDFYRWAMGKPFSQISMAHGQLLTTDAREQFYQLFSSYSPYASYGRS